MRRRIHLTMPEDVLNELHNLIPAGKRSNFVAEMIRRGIKLLKLMHEAEASFGAWKFSVHEELGQGTESYVRSCRQNSRSIEEQTLDG